MIKSMSRIAVSAGPTARNVFQVGSRCLRLPEHPRCSGTPRFASTPQSNHSSTFLKPKGAVWFSGRRHFSDSSEHCEAADHPWLKLLPEVPESFLPEERVLTLLSGNIAAGRLADVAQDWRHLPSSWHSQGMEVVLQTHLFAGFARAINGLATVQAVGVHCETPEWSAEVPDLESWRRSGEASCEAIYGRVYPKLRDRMGKMHPLLDSMMIEHGYGRVLSRPGLSLRLRELCVIAVLAGLDVAPQLNSHLRGAVRVGATAEEVKAVVAQTALVWGEEAQAQAQATLETVVAARYGL